MSGREAIQSPSAAETSAEQSDVTDAGGNSPVGVVVRHGAEIGMDVGLSAGPRTIVMPSSTRSIATTAKAVSRTTGWLLASDRDREARTLDMLMALCTTSALVSCARPPVGFH